MKTKDLSDMWIKKALSKEKSALQTAENALNSLVDKKTDYAKGIERMVIARRKIVEIWEEA